MNPLRSLTFLLPFLLSSGTAVASSRFDDHAYLYNSIRSVGIVVQVNPPDCNGSVDGFYQSRSRRLVICQDNMRQADVEVDWTLNDYDTLRHEAQHLVQDCNGAGYGNGYLKPLMSERYPINVLGHATAHGLMQNDSYRGAPRSVHLIELEAFAVAQEIGPRQIAEKVLQCRSAN
jgi:hypothetical protein